VVLVRPSGAGWETYLLRRSAQSPVLANLWVFPGGTVRPADIEAEIAACVASFGPAEARAALERPPSVAPESGEECLGYFVTAARETFEEAGVLLARRPGASHLLSFSGDEGEDARLSQLRLALEQGGSFAELAEELQVELALDQLVYYAHWITPLAVPTRFDTRFFIATVPPGQQANPSPFEMVEGHWLGAREALELDREGTISLHFATASQLERLAPFGTLKELRAFARTKPIHDVMPQTRTEEGKVVPHLPEELRGLW